MTIPKTAKGLSNRISKIRSQFSAFKREYGFIDDGSGLRYYLFYLYFLLGDNRRAYEYLRWYEKEFPDDMGEPLSFLCWALMLHRMGKGADYQLFKTMLSNIYLIPSLLGRPMEKVDLWHSLNWEHEDYIQDFPEQILEAITDEDLDWIASRYNSEPFQKVLDRYMDIHHQLLTTPVGDARTELVRESYSLLDHFR